jgi:hypothetical protein
LRLLFPSHPTPRTDHREILKKTETDRAEIFWRKKLEKQNADICRWGAKSTRVSLPDKGMEYGGDHPLESPERDAVASFC